MLLAGSLVLCHRLLPSCLLQRLLEKSRIWASAGARIAVARGRVGCEHVISLTFTILIPLLTALPDEMCSHDGDSGHDGNGNTAEYSLCARRFTRIISLICTMILWSVDSYPHFSHGETEAEKGKVTCQCPQVGGDRSRTSTLRGEWFQAEKAKSRPERLAFLVLHAEQNFSAGHAEKFAGDLLLVLALKVLRLGAPSGRPETVGPLVGACMEESVGWVCTMELGDPPAVGGSGSLKSTSVSRMRSACKGSSSQPVCASEHHQLHPLLAPLERRCNPHPRSFSPCRHLAASVP